MLKINFKLDAPLTIALQKLVSGKAPAAQAVTIVDEVMTQKGPLQSSGGDLAADLKSVCTALQAEHAETAYVVVRVSPAKLAVVVYVNDSAKPRDRMMYSAGVGHLQEALATPHVLTIQASDIAEINTSMFTHKENDAERESLMTESERNQARIAAMELAPQPTALPGVSIPLSEEARQLAVKYKLREVSAISFRVDADSINVDRYATEFAGLPVAKALIPPNEPRFVIARYTNSERVREAEGTMIMVYVCPDACKARDKMPYATSRASFLSQLGSCGLHFPKRIEIGGIEEFVSAVEDSFPAPPPEGVRVPPPKPLSCKDNRTLS